MLYAFRFMIKYRVLFFLICCAQGTVFGAPPTDKERLQQNTTAHNEPGVFSYNIILRFLNGGALCRFRAPKWHSKLTEVYNNDVRRFVIQEGAKGVYNWQKAVLNYIFHFVEDVDIQSNLPLNSSDLIRHICQSPDTRLAQCINDVLLTACPEFRLIYDFYHIRRLNLDFEIFAPVGSYTLNERNRRVELRRHFLLRMINMRDVLPNGCPNMLMRGFSARSHPGIGEAPETEKVAIIGGGYTGVMTALLLARLTRRDGSPLYSVHLYEQNKQLMTEASLMPGRLHLGGEYPLDVQTSRDCLLSALIFRQMFTNERIYTRIPAVAYLLGKETEGLTLEQMRENFEQIKNAYAHYYNALLTEYDDNTAALLFGTPEELFSDISDEVTRTLPAFRGGFKIHERGFHSIYLGAYLEYLLEKFNVHTHTGKNVYLTAYFGISNHDVLQLGIEGGGIQEPFQHIVNATNVNFEAVNPLLPRGDLTYCHTRAILLVDISRCTIPMFSNEKCALFGLKGAAGGMVSPFNKNLALFYWPDIEGAYVGSQYLMHGYYSGAIMYDAQFIERTDAEQRRLKIWEVLLERYPMFQGSQPLKLHLAATLNTTEVLEARIHSKAKLYNGQGSEPFHLNRDYSVVLAQKATYAPLAALQAVKTVLTGSRARGYFERADIDLRIAKYLADIYENGVTEENVVLPKRLRLNADLDQKDFEERARLYAKVRELPEEFLTHDIS